MSVEEALQATELFCRLYMNGKDTTKTLEIFTAFRPQLNLQKKFLKKVKGLEAKQEPRLM